MPDVFTIGYEGLQQPQLLDLVKSAGVAVVLDVRAIAASRKAGFSKTVLRASLADCGMAYMHDIRLGTPKAGRDAVRRGRVSEMAVIFDTHMRTEPAVAGLADAIALARAQPTCLLCFEASAHDCHRNILAHMIREHTGQTIRHL